MNTNPSSKQIIDVTEKWLQTNADTLPLEVRVLVYKAVEDEKRELEGGNQ